MRIRACTALAVLPLAFTLALTGCGSDGNGNDGVAGNSPSLSQNEMLVKFAQCLRKNGIDVKDPEPGKGLVMPGIDGADAQATSDKATEACREYAPPAPSDEDNARERKEMLEFARCMRRNGVEKFADPKDGGGVDIGPGQAEDPDFKKAEKKCGGAGVDTNSNSVPR